MLRLPRGRRAKSYYTEEKAREKGKLQAQIESKSKVFKYKKHTYIWLREQVEKNLHRIPEGVAILGMTVLVKHAIDASEELRGILADFPRDLAYAIGDILFKIFNIQKEEKPPSQDREKYEGFFPDWADWLIAFSIAYIIVKHGGQIALGLGDAVSGLTGMVKFLMV